MKKVVSVPWVTQSVWGTNGLKTRVNLSETVWIRWKWVFRNWVNPRKSCPAQEVWERMLVTYLAGVRIWFWE